ncbi:MAG: ATP-grasp domain-containing protein [Chloroflexota bacterium]
MAEQRLLLLMSTRTYRAAAFLEAAETLGMAVTVASDKPHVFADVQPEAHLQVDFNEPESATERIVEFSQQYPLAAVVSAEDEGAQILAMASMALGLPSSSLTAVSAARNKFAMRTILHEAGIRSPKYQRMQLTDDPHKLARQVDYPCVLKPLFLSGSRGVMRANNMGEFVGAFARIKAILSRPKVKAEGRGLADYVLVEDYIPGNEVAIEGIVMAGEMNLIAMFDKPDPLDGPYFEETIYVTPSRHPEVAQEALWHTARKAVKILEITHGPVHIEARYNEQGAWIVEIAPRSIGGYCSKVITLDAGLTLEEAILWQAVGQDVFSLEREALAAGVMMIPIPDEGILEAISGVAEAQKVTYIDEIVVSMHKGQQVTPLPEGGQYLGFIFARAESPETVEKALRTAYSKINLTVR